MNDETMTEKILKALDLAVAADVPATFTPEQAAVIRRLLYYEKPPADDRATVIKVEKLSKSSYMIINDLHEKLDHTMTHLDAITLARSINAITATTIPSDVSGDKYRVSLTNLYLKVQLEGLEMETYRQIIREMLSLLNKVVAIFYDAIDDEE